jgi:hypothetical protein
MASLDGAVHVGAGDVDIDDRTTGGADEMVVESFVDVVSEF